MSAPRRSYGSAWAARSRARTSSGSNMREITGEYDSGAGEGNSLPADTENSRLQSPYVPQSSQSAFHSRSESNSGEADSEHSSSPHVTQVVSGATPRTPSGGQFPTLPQPPLPPQLPAAPVWKRALYERQPFDDNYVDPEQFLEKMRKNAHIKQYPYLVIVRDMFALVQQISITVIFVVVFVAVHSQAISLAQMVGMNTLILLVSVAVYLALHEPTRTNPTATFYDMPHRHSSAIDHASPSRGARGGLASDESTTVTRGSKDKKSSGAHSPPAPIAKTGTVASLETKDSSSTAIHNEDEVTFMGCVRQGVVFTCVLLILAPIFKTMTASYTSDTIQALCILLLFIHNVLTDYNYINGYKTKFEQNMAGNAALFSSVLLASRIQSPAYASMLIGFGVQCFTLSPLLRHHLKRQSVEGHVALTFTLCGIAIGCLINFSPILAALFVTAVVSMVFVIPWAFVWMQRRYKFQINGPWDEAKPVNSAAAAEWANSGLLS